MLQKPPIADDALAACVRESYGVTVAQLEFLPLGEDTDAGVYRVEADEGTAYFLKVRRGEVYSPSVTVPRALREAGMTEVVAPLPTIRPSDPSRGARSGSSRCCSTPSSKGRAAGITGCRPSSGGNTARSCGDSTRPSCRKRWRKRCRASRLCRPRAIAPWSRRCSPESTSEATTARRRGNYRRWFGSGARRFAQILTPGG